MPEKLVGYEQDELNASNAYYTFKIFLYQGTEDYLM